MATKKTPKKVSTKEKHLSSEQELFCILYTGHHNRDLFGNATRSYMESYNLNSEIEELKKEIQELQTFRDTGYTVKVKTIELRIKSVEASARSCSNRLLTKANIRRRIDELMDLMVENNFNDRELQFAISQRYDLPSKVAAIREYNALKKRIKEAGTQTGPITIHIAPEILAKMK